MKKIFSLLLVLTLFVGLLPLGNSASANGVKSDKELANELVTNPKEWKNLSKQEKEAIKEYANQSKEIMKEIDKKAKKADKEEEKAKIFKEEFQQLNEEEKLSVLVYQTPVEIEEIEEVMHDDITEKPENRKVENNKFSFSSIFNSMVSFIETPKAHAANKTNYFRQTVRAKNVYGTKLWDFWTSNYWSYDGVKIRSIDPKEGKQIYSSGWSYTGKNVESWYNYAGFDYHRNVEGYFQLTIGSTWQKGTAYIDTRVRANGAWSAPTDLQWSWTN